MLNVSESQLKQIVYQRKWFRNLKWEIGEFAENEEWDKNRNRQVSAVD